ncbi:hypothetical protein FGG08_001834 [Glutinoglossum americanum]|uniref:RCC1/BLIP-II protein n=1 Tax=Glutinoglossum americanum TaxID=1670608 RepID=A0A9P8IAL2_9PEZI|nr:hypothetical protein FGG08_001834 [Glutinoglossum americanum]
MDLYACGFNAHRQLASNGSPPGDRIRLQRICGGNYTVRVLFAGWADTLWFGDHTGLKGAVSDDDAVYALSPRSDSLSFVRLPSLSKVKQIVVAGNGRACALLNAREVVEFPLLQDLLQWLTTPSSVQSFELPPYETATHLTAAATSFGLLTTSGTIYTWSSDTRPSPLGRPPTPIEPGPLAVDALGGVPIKKLACAGWLAAAVSRDNELYIWGGGGPGGTRKISDLEDVNGFESVALARVGATREGEDGVDVADVGVGDHHIVALSGEGRVFAVGEGTNGQLGAGEAEFSERWVECEFEGPEQRGRAVGVHCGPRNTFVLVERA